MAKSIEEKVEEHFKALLDELHIRHFGKTETINSSITKALKEADSKSGGSGSNFPDIQLLLQNKTRRDIPVMIEAKGLKNKLEKLTPSGDIELVSNGKNQNLAVQQYAVNGALHYGLAILDEGTYGEVIVIGINGTSLEDGKLKDPEVKAYYVAKKNDRVPKELVGFDFVQMKQSNIDSFFAKLDRLSLTDAEKEKLKRDKEELLERSIKDIHQKIYDDVNINPNMTKSELGIPKNLSYAFIDFADDGFPELVVANVDKNGYKVLDLVGIEVDLQSPDQTKTAKRIFDQFPSKSFNLRLIRYLVEEDEDKESDDSDSESDEETDSKKDDKDKDDKDKDGKKKDDKDKDDKKDSKDDEEEEEWMNLLYTADWDPDSDVRMMDLDILNPRMVTTTSFMEIRRRPDLKDGEDDAFTVREGDEEAESVSEEKYTAVTYGIMENSKDYEVDWNPISDWKG